MFFFLMIRRPPRSTLFPYTTALPISPAGSAAGHARSPEHRFGVGMGAEAQDAVVTQLDSIAHAGGVEDENVAVLLAVRSEEHTSELQSRQYLVCRLLLEKKTI